MPTWLEHAPRTPTRELNPSEPASLDHWWAEGMTTVMIRNIPNSFTRTPFIAMLNDLGLEGKFDFFYLPFDFQRESNLGYAFINMLSVEDVDLLKQKLNGYHGWKCSSDKICQVAPGPNYRQGRDANIKHYQNRAVMHHQVPEDWKPLWLENGIPQIFPPPTKGLRNPFKSLSYP